MSKSELEEAEKALLQAIRDMENEEEIKRRIAALVLAAMYLGSL